MSAVTTSSLSDTLPSTVPKLNAEGDNWAIFYVRFMDAVEAKGFWGHFDGSSAAPELPATATDADLSAKSQWDKDERSAKTLLTQKLPDSTVMEIHSLKTVKERWEVVVKEYTVKGAYAQTEMRAKFLSSRCPEKGNAKDFLRGLRLKKEELAQVGVKISDEDYMSTIISSLPDTLSNFASMHISLSTQNKQPVDASTLMTMLLQEAERQNLRSQRRKQGTGKSKEDEKSEALAVSADKPRGKKDSNGKVLCWNCGEEGHLKHKCPKPKKSKDDSASKPAEKPEAKKEGTSAVANVAEPTSDEDGAWAAEELLIESGGDWFDEVCKAEAKHASMLCVDVSVADDGGESQEETGGGMRVEDLGDTSGEAFVVAESVQTSGRAELYDSGCTNHISPYRSSFENFQTIEPRHFRAANKQTFSTVGKGELVIDIPNDTGVTQFRLHDVLYSPEVAYTLVSIGRLDEDGFFATFGGGKCIIKDANKEIVGVVQKIATRIYKIEHEEGVANEAEERLTLGCFHRRMGHVAPDTARKLVKDKLVTGVRLEYTPYGRPFFCASCVYAKATRKPVPRMREGERAKEFGGEVHSDLWGLAPVESKGGKRYYITFIDDKTRLTTLYLLRTKDEAPKVYKQYKAWVVTQMGVAIKVLNSDRGGEYQGSAFVEYLKTKGTQQKLNVHDTPQHAGVAERRNRTIGERIWALLHASGLPRFLWGEAARHAVWLLNRTTTKAVDGMTPFEAAFGKKPDLKKVREWGEKVFVRIEGGTKLGGRVREGRWMGIDNESKGVRVYWPESKTVTVERNVYFDNSSVSRLEEEQEPVALTKTTIKNEPQRPTDPPTTNLQDHPEDLSTPESDADARAKRV